MELEKQFFKKLSHYIGQLGTEKFESTLSAIERDYFLPEIRIGLWGQYSSGKSSFLNAIIGKDILPCAITETTATITELLYGAYPHLKVELYNNKNYKLDYSKEMAWALLTTAKNSDKLPFFQRNKLNLTQFDNDLKYLLKEGIIKDGNGAIKSNIKKVKIFLKDEFLKNGNVYVDLPGLCGDRGRENISVKEIGNCQIVLYFKAIDKPVDQYDKEVLELLSLKTQGMVLFAIHTKLDIKLKEHYSSLGNNEKVLELLKIFSEELKNELSEFSKIDSFFALSPIACLYLKHASDNNELAIQELKKDYKNKFRFLESKHDLSLISGYKGFSDEFYKNIMQFREIAKQRVLNGSLQVTLKNIESYLEDFENSIMSEHRLSVDEYDKIAHELDKINTKILKLGNVDETIVGKVDDPIRNLVLKFYTGWIDQALLQISEKDVRAYNSSDILFKDFEKRLITIMNNNFQNTMLKKEFENAAIPAVNEFFRKYEETVGCIRKISSVFINADNFKSNNDIGSDVGKLVPTIETDVMKDLAKKIASKVALEIAACIAFDLAFDAIFFGFAIVIKTVLDGNYNSVGELLIAIAKNLGDLGANTIDLIQYFVTSDEQAKKEIAARLLMRVIKKESGRKKMQNKIYETTNGALTASLILHSKNIISKKIKEKRLIENLKVYHDSQRELVNKNSIEKATTMKEKKHKLERFQNVKSQIKNHINNNL